MFVRTLLVALALTAAGRVHAQSDDNRSPFLPPNAPGSGGSAEEAGATYELAGASTTGSGTQICLYNTVTKHSRWLNVGQSDGGIQVLSYDGNNDQAVVRFDGQTHVIALRKVKTGTTGIGGPVFAAVPSAPLPGTSQAANAPTVDPSTVGKSPEVIKQERDARMLVSDLLEISIAQRKAYEEAQRKAQAQAGKKPQP